MSKNNGKVWLGIESCKHPMWKGGISKEPYCFEFTTDLKEFIKQRDNYKCQNPDCRKSSNKLVPHHIDYNKKNCELNNLITLCTSCNSKANFNRERWKTYYKMLIKREEQNVRI